MKINLDKKSTIMLAAVLIFLFSGCAGASNEERSTPSDQNIEPSFASSACIDGITPGKSTKQDVLNKWGEPASASIDEDGIENMIYDIGSVVFSNKVSVVEDTVVWIDNYKNQDLKLSDLVSRYGQPEKTAFSFFAQTARTYLYPQQGFIATVSEESDAVILLHCFIPMSLDEYLSGMGGELPEENPFTY